MSSIAILSQGKRTASGAHIARKTIIPKNKYSQLYREHKAKMDAGQKPPQDFHNPKIKASDMIIESKV